MTTATPTTNTQYGFCFHPDLGRDDCSGPLRLWVGCCGETRFISTMYDIRRDEWDAVKGHVILHGDSTRGPTCDSDGGFTDDSGSRRDSRRERLSLYAAGMERDLELVGDIVREFEGSHGEFTADDIVDAFNMRRSE